MDVAPASLVKAVEHVVGGAVGQCGGPQDDGPVTAVAGVDRPAIHVSCLQYKVESEM